MSEVVDRLKRIIADLEYLVQLPGHEVASELQDPGEMMDAILDCYMITRGLDVRPTGSVERLDNPVR